MKIFYKTFALGAFLAVLAVVTPTFGQDDVCADIEANKVLYAKYTDVYKGEVTRTNAAAKEMAVAVAKEYVEKYKNCKDFEAQVTWLTGQSPKLAKKIADARLVFAAEDRVDRFNKAVPSGKAAEIFAAGNDILKYQPELLDVMIVLAATGLDEAAVNKNNNFNNDAISYAKAAIKSMEGDGKSKKYGIFKYEYDTKENAIGWMNYTIGYIMFYGQNSTDSAIPYLYEATQSGPEVKEKYFIYQLIADTYRARAVALGNEIIEMLKTTPDGKETFETKSKYALQKGYAERAVDAYARAYNFGKAAKPAPSDEYLNGLKTILGTFYKFRFVKDTDPTENLDAQVMNYVASVSNKPFPSPTTEVDPVDPPKEGDEDANPDGAASSDGDTAATDMKPAPMPTGKPVSETRGDAAKNAADKGKSEADKTKPKHR